jgi:hypothetical protein
MPQKAGEDYCVEMLRNSPCTLTQRLVVDLTTSEPQAHEVFLNNKSSGMDIILDNTSY